MGMCNWTLLVSLDVLEYAGIAKDVTCMAGTQTPGTQRTQQQPSELQRKCGLEEESIGNIVLDAKCKRSHCDHTACDTIVGRGKGCLNRPNVTINRTHAVRAHAYTSAA